jgi:hypothetical protein
MPCHEGAAAGFQSWKVEVAKRKTRPMKQSARTGNNEYLHAESPSSGKLPFFRFLMRYPVFLLAFGPPIFRPNVGIDATKGSIDIWAFLQAGFVVVIAIRAVMRLISSHHILIPRQTRSILRYIFILGFLFMASAEYSPSRAVSAAYAILFLCSVICVVEFVADVYRNPPDWMQSLLHLRMIFFLLFLLVLVTIPFNPDIVMGIMPGVGIRLGGGAVAPITIICPVMVLISAYTFLNSLETRVRAAFFLLVGLAGTLISQSRGSEIALLAALVILGMLWAGTGKRAAYLFISSAATVALSSVAVLAVIGGDRIWNLFNKNQSLEGIKTASGRTDIWSFVVHYSMQHPLGMGYVAGFRKIFKEYFALGLQVEVSHIGNAHNAFIDVLADAGWPALAVYLFLLIKVVAIGWRYARKKALIPIVSDYHSQHALRCAMILLAFCFFCGMDTAEFSVPLRAAFYFQNILIAMILGITARMIVASRARSPFPAYGDGFER